MKRKSVASSLRRMLEVAVRALVPDRFAALVFRMAPIARNRVLFQTFQGDYCCNPRAVTEALAGSEGVELVWALSRKASRRDVPKSVKVVRRGSVRHLYMIATSRVWFENGLTLVRAEYAKKRRGQVYMQPLHGSLGLKKQGLFADELRDKADRITDYCISNSTFEDMVYRTSYWPTTEILRYGHPRNDVFFLPRDAREAVARKVRGRLKVGDGTRMALYAPTFRPDDDTSCFNVDVPGLKAALKARFGGEWTVVARLHKRNRRAIGFSFGGEAVDATSYPDMQELMLACDVGITDYSSWICDFVLGDGFGFLYAPDLEKYGSETGFYYPLSETPFPVARSNGELQSAIAGFDEDEYRRKREEFLRARGCVEDGHASERCAAKILEVVASPLPPPRTAVGRLAARLSAFRELVVYCLIGCTGAGLDFLIYSVLVAFAGVHYQAANFLSVTAGIVNNFFLNFFFNFKVRDRVWRRLASFYAVGMFGWALSALCLWAGVEVLKLGELAAKLASIVLVTIVQFTLNKLVTFRKSRGKAREKLDV